MELFGFREFSHVFDVAGRCAAGLAALGEGPRWEQRLSALLPHSSAARGGRRREGVALGVRGRTHAFS